MTSTLGVPVATHGTVPDVPEIDAGGQAELPALT
jgi:hypothetical protein